MILGGYWAKRLHTNSSSDVTISGNAHCVLHSVTINTKGATANLLTLWDGPSATGTQLASIDTTSNVGTLIYDIQCNTSLVAVLNTGTAADVTISYK